MTGFWLQFEQSPCLPDQCNCEYISNELIRQPNAFWTSIPYILFALWLFRQVKQRNFEFNVWIGLFTLVGLCSMFGHASFTKLSMAMDFAAIIVLISYFSLFHAFNRAKASFLIFLVVYYALVIVAMYVLDKWTKVALCLIIFFISLVDLLRQTKWRFMTEHLLLQSILILILSFAFFLVDELRIICDPHSVWQFHSLWHLGTAAAIYAYSRWRFKDLLA